MHNSIKEIQPDQFNWIKGLSYRKVYPVVIKNVMLGLEKEEIKN